MSTYSPNRHSWDGTKTAAADLSAKQYHLVKISSATAVNLCTADTDIAWGVLQNKPTSGQVAVVATEGECKVAAGEAITAGTNLAPDGTSRVKPAATGDQIIGHAIDSAGGAGVIFRMLIIHGGIDTTA